MRMIALMRVFSAVMFSLVLLAGCVTFEGELPVELDVPETVYISPANRDGVQDELIIPVDLTLPIPEVAVEGFRITITDPERMIVKKAEESLSKAQLRELPRAQRKKAKFSDYVLWDGTDQEGEYVADGEYLYWLEAWDRQGNTGQTPFYYVVVDNTPPSVDVSLPYPVFSPNGDGRLEMLSINQRHSTSEDLWSGEIRDAQHGKIKSFSWEGRAGDFSWDGTKDSGGPAPDGTYSYVLSSTDPAGNSSSFLVCIHARAGQENLCQSYTLRFEFAP